MNFVSIRDVKIAMSDSDFRKKLPETLREDIQKYEQNPGCSCNLSVYKRVLKYGIKQLQEYFPGRMIENIDEELQKLSENHWTVINCHKDELEKRLKELPNGRKQLAVCRFEDQCTVIVNELDMV